MRASANPSANPKVVTTTQVIGVVDKTEISNADVLAGDGQVFSSVVKPPRAGDKQLTWYRVTKGGFVGIEGIRARIPEGKELHDGAFDIRSLRKQGIVLQELGLGPATGYVEPEPAATGT